MKDTFTLNKAFCCPGFQNSLEAAGQRGIAILTKDSSIGLMFLLQSRGIAFDDISKMRPQPGAPDIKINISCETGLKYCPWCGRDLQQLANVSPEIFQNIARKHQYYIQPLA